MLFLDYYDFNPSNFQYPNTSVNPIQETTELILNEPYNQELIEKSSNVLVYVAVGCIVSNLIKMLFYISLCFGFLDKLLFEN